MELIEKLKKNYNLTDSGFNQLTESVSLDSVINPLINKCFFHAKEMILDAISHHEKIMIYGDYDVDGITATSIIHQTLTMLNANVGYYIPNRYIDGYGITPEKVKQIAEKGYKLLITVDNGISQNEALALAHTLGLTVILTDHHELIGEMPYYDEILHPSISLLTPDKISGAYIALLLSFCLLGRYDDYLVTLAGIAVLSDAMPLNVMSNRTLLKTALNNINTHKYKSILFLTLTGEEIDEEVLNFQVIPKFNAVGRVEKTIAVNNLVKYLNDKNEISPTLVTYIVAANDLRRSFSSDGADLDFTGKSAIVYLSNVISGVSGIIASRLASTYKVPAVVLCQDERNEDKLVGSMRSSSAFDVVGSLKTLKEYLVNFGGHKAAGGLTIEKSKVADFTLALSKIADEFVDVKIENKCIDISFEELNNKTLKIIKNLSPFGQEFPRPLFSLTMIADELKFSRDKKHVLMSRNNVKIVAFGFGKLVSNNQDKKLKLFGYIGKSEYNGVKYIEFKVKDIEIIGCVSNIR